ncbi:MAG: hypothetical protein Q9182_001751 [Xanthomendoza sp. 2 TL-2023]
MCTIAVSLSLSSAITTARQSKKAFSVSETPKPRSTRALPYNRRELKRRSEKLRKSDSAQLQPVPSWGQYRYGKDSSRHTYLFDTAVVARSLGKENIMKTSYRHLALLLHSLCSAIHLVSSHALPARPPSRPSPPSLSLPPTLLTITQNIHALVNTLTADPNPIYSTSVMLSCELAVEFYEHGDTPHDLFHSSKINHFHDIRCVFRYGGPSEDNRQSHFIVENKFPEHWDQWSSPTPVSFIPGDYLLFAWSEVENHLSVERADQLLKAAGHEPGPGFIGKYDMVHLRKRRANGLAWCFENVIGDYPDGSAQRTYLVSASTGRVEQTRHC